MHIDLGTVGLTNPLIDFSIQGFAYPRYAHNNPYNVQVLSEEVYNEAMHNMTKPGGCTDLIDRCRFGGIVSDPEEFGINATVNNYCVTALNYCFGVVQGAYGAHSNVSKFGWVNGATLM
jgi:hypothetical protein